MGEQNSTLEKEENINIIKDDANGDDASTNSEITKTKKKHTNKAIENVVIACFIVIFVAFAVCGYVLINTNSDDEATETTTTIEINGEEYDGVSYSEDGEAAVYYSVD